MLGFAIQGKEGQDAESSELSLETTYSIDPMSPSRQFIFNVHTSLIFVEQIENMKKNIAVQKVVNQVSLPFLEKDNFLFGILLTCRVSKVLKY